LSGKSPSRFFLESCFLNRVSPRSGFTIIETLVAMAVLVLAIVAPLTLAERSLASVESSGSEITALYLAQEAIEFVRNLRDANALVALKAKDKKADWLTGLEECLVADGAEAQGCGVDPTANEATERIFVCGDEVNNKCRVWRRDSGDSTDSTDPLQGIFGHPETRTGGGGTGGWKETIFTRRVFLTKTGTDENAEKKEPREPREAQVQVQVDWTAGALGKRHVTIQSALFDWSGSR
ncbi:MAG: hypothetical protein Greene041679_482, partial [Parcubacteria group bacterium Greene0416_79]